MCRMCEQTKSDKHNTNKRHAQTSKPDTCNSTPHHKTHRTTKLYTQIGGVESMYSNEC